MPPGATLTSGDEKTRPYLADALAFLDLPGKPLIAHPDLRLDLAHVTVAPPLPWNTEKLAQYVCKSIHEIGFGNNGKMSVGLNASDIKLKAANKTVVVMGLQAPPEERSFGFPGIMDLFNSGVRVFQLWYKGENRFGGGFACPTVHITDECKLALRALADLGAILDLSHAGHTSAREVLAYIRDQKIPLKVMVSHTGCYSMFSHIRNLPDDVLRDVAKLGGVVGIYTLTFGLSSEDDSLNPFRRHLAHAVNICGAENIVIGTDGAYQPAGSKEEGLAQFEKMRAMVDGDGLFNARYPEQPWETYSPNKMTTIADRIFVDFNGDSVIKKVDGIIGLNLKRFFENALPQ